MIAITFALPTESSDLQKSRNFAAKRIAKCGNSKIVYGTIANLDVALFYTGVGRKACEHNIETFLTMVRPKLLISSGFAGGVDSNLKVGDVIVGENFSDPGLIKNFQGKVKLFTASSVIDSVDERGRIAREQGAAAVDMETEVIAKACAARGIRMLSLRTISDTSDEPFPLPVSMLFNLERQKTPFGALLWYFCRHPGAILRLIRFSKQIGEARRRLEQAIMMVVLQLLCAQPLKGYVGL